MVEIREEEQERSRTSAVGVLQSERLKPRRSIIRRAPRNLGAGWCLVNWPGHLRSDKLALELSRVQAENKVGI